MSSSLPGSGDMLSLSARSCWGVREVSGGQVSILGGGTLDGSAMLQAGEAEKKELEQQLIEKRGFGEAEPPVFFVG